MRVTTNRRISYLAAAAILALLVGACGGTTTPAVTATPKASTPAPVSTTASAPTVSGPMTGEELVWIEAINTLLTKIQRVSSLPCCETKAAMRAVEDGMRGCTRELTRLGLPTDRLKPVYQLVQQACAKYDKAATCFATAAGSPSP